MNATALPRRYLCLWMPFLTSDRWRCENGQEDDRPLVFVEKQRGASRLVAIDHRAQLLGLRTGITLADARARVPRLRALASKPALDAAYLDRLADLTQGFTPSVMLDLPDGLALDITGCTHIASCAELGAQRDGSWGRVAGVVLVRQRPGKGNAIFITLEDESGIVNAVLWARTFEKFRGEVMGGRLLLIEGRVQRNPENVVHLMVHRVIDRTTELYRLSDDRKTVTPLSPADEFAHPQASRTRHPRDVRILPRSRDFH